MPHEKGPKFISGKKYDCIIKKPCNTVNLTCIPKGN